MIHMSDLMADLVSLEVKLIWLRSCFPCGVCSEYSHLWETQTWTECSRNLYKQATESYTPAPQFLPFFLTTASAKPEAIAFVVCTAGRCFWEVSKAASSIPKPQILEIHDMPMEVQLAVMILTGTPQEDPSQVN